MDRRLLDIAVSGHAAELMSRASRDPALLLARTPQGNTCLHIASIHGHQEFCKDVLALSQSQCGSLLTGINGDGETPLLTAVSRGRHSLASILLRFCRDQKQSEAILKQDKHGCNALHHAIRRGYRKLAFELIEAEPELSKAVNKHGESPMFIAVMRNFTDVLDKLLEIPGSADSGPCGFNVLHAAVRNGNSDVAKSVLERRPSLARQENRTKRYTPIHLAAYEDKVDLLTVLLEHDPSLGYLLSADDTPLLYIAASQGHVGIARELLKYCPDAPYCDANGSTCLHVAVSSSEAVFVKFVLESQQLQHLINMVNSSGKTAVHLAATGCQKEMVDAFLLHRDTDITVLGQAGNHAKALITLARDTDSTGSLQATTFGSTISTRLHEATTTGNATILLQPTYTDSTALLQEPISDSTICTHLQEAATTRDTTIVLEPAYTDSTASLQEPNSASRTGTLLMEAATTRDATIMLEPTCTDSTGSLQGPTTNSTVGTHLREGATLGDATTVLESAYRESTASLQEPTSDSTIGTRLQEAATTCDATIVQEPAYMDWSASLQEPTSTSRIGTLLLEAATTMLEPASTNSTCSLQGPTSDSTIRTRLQEVATTGDNTIVLEPAYTDSTASLQEPTSASRTGTETARTGDTTIVLQPACTYSPGSLQVPTSESRIGPPLLEADTTGDATIVPDLACTDSTDLLEGSTSASTMGTRLLEAATIGDTTIVLQPASHDPVVLLATTPQGNTCLHIASIQGHEEFCMKILTLDQSRVLLSAVNEDGETALLTAVSRGRATLASLLLRRCRDQQLIEAILKQDKRGCNALHHSICNGHVKLALELIEAEPDLSRAVNKQNESPMFAAVMRNQTDVFEKLLEIPSSAHGGVFGNNALHAAARNGNSGDL